MKNPLPYRSREAGFCLLCSFGAGYSRLGNFENLALKSQETRMNTEKNRGDIYFVTPSWRAWSDSKAALLHTAFRQSLIFPFRLLSLSVSPYLLSGFFVYSHA